MADIFDSNLDNVEIEVSDNKIVKGDDINLTAKDPTLNNIMVGIGWQLNAFDAETLDLDVSCFLLNKDGQTRIDEDFIFYNNMDACDGAIIHNGDNRTGAGDGDDETITMDLNGIPFDVVEVMFVISVYRGAEKDQSMAGVRNGYIRVLNASNGQEMLRYVLDEDAQDANNETAMLVASLVREGPKWHFKALGQPAEGGLAQVATDYGIIVHTG